MRQTSHVAFIFTSIPFSISNHATNARQDTSVCAKLESKRVGGKYMYIDI